MIRRLLPLLALLACVQPAPRIESVPPPPQLAATAQARRVVLVSFDGLGADALASRTDLPAFARLTAEGAATRVIPVNPTSTWPAHVTLLTGAQPDVHGVVANRFHVPGTPPEVTARAPEAPIDVETLVEAAQRQGKVVGSVPFPTVDARTPRRRSDFGFAYSDSVTPSRTIRLTRGDFHREWVPPTWTQQPSRRPSYSPIMRARIEWSIAQRHRNDVDVVAYDTTNDSAANYDLLLIESAEREITPDPRGWFALSTQMPDGLFGSWSKILSATPSLDVAIYWGPVSRTNAWPASFQHLLDSEIGFWPGAPEDRKDTGVATFMEQMERLTNFVTHAQTLAIRRMPFDLLLAYHSAIDSTGHNFLGASEPAMRSADTQADRALAAIAAALDLTQDALVVTGDHGLTPIDTEVRMNRLLADGGFTPRWRAYASGNVAHLYRFEGTDDADALIAALRSTDWFELVTRRGVTQHRNTGDVIVFAKPNVTLTPSSESPVSTRPDNTAHHGALNTHRELHTVLLVRGAGVPRVLPSEVPQAHIARFVARLIGMQPPAAAE